MSQTKHEKTLVLIKPDAVVRNILGEIISRFERKGLKIIGLKMISLDDQAIEDHYGKYKDKPFFSGLSKFMKSTPVVAIALDGYNAVNATRLIAGPTKGYEADAGSIRGDFSLSTQSNIVHASDSVESAEEELARFFSADELHEYAKPDFDYIYAEDER